jgi:hypothetical protein
MKRFPVLFFGLIFLGTGTMHNGFLSSAADLEPRIQRELLWYTAPADFQDKIIGTWMLFSVESINPDRSKIQPFGPAPVGRVVFDSTGHFMLLSMATTLPKFASNNRATGTPEENKAIVTGSLGLFGSYKVDEAEKVLIWRIEACTFPNWIGQEQKSQVELVTDEELKFLNPATSIGGGLHRLTWKRVN